MNCSMPGLPVCHQLPEFTQTHVHQVGDAIQPSHLLSKPSPPTPNPSQHQGLFQRVNSSHEVAKVFLPLEWYYLHIWGCYFSQQSWFQHLTNPDISHDLLWIEVKEAGWQYTALSYSFSNFEPVSCSMSSSHCCFLTHIQVSQETGEHLF